MSQIPEIQNAIARMEAAMRTVKAFDPTGGRIFRAMYEVIWPDAPPLPPLPEPAAAAVVLEPSSSSAAAAAAIKPEPSSSSAAAAIKPEPSSSSAAVKHKPNPEAARSSRSAPKKASSRRGTKERAQIDVVEINSDPEDAGSSQRPIQVKMEKDKESGGKKRKKAAPPVPADLLFFNPATLATVSPVPGSGESPLAKQSAKRFKQQGADVKGPDEKAAKGKTSKHKAGAAKAEEEEDEEQQIAKQAVAEMQATVKRREERKAAKAQREAELQAELENIRQLDSSDDD